MATPLKELFDLKRIEEIARSLAKVYPTFEVRDFVTAASYQLDTLELKERVAQIAAVMRRMLPTDYPTALGILLKSLGPPMEDDEDLTSKGLPVWPYAQFIESYGLDHLEESLAGMKEVTQRFSAEFAIRPYLLRYPEPVMAQLHEWATHPNLHVRRLVSEGTRPRLPWGLRLQPFIENPYPSIELLTLLKDDPELYVRRSVANHLNDISKDHPQLVIDTLKEWLKGGTENTKWIARHAMRGLLKAGNPQALELMGFGKPSVKLLDLTVSPARLEMGENLGIHLDLCSTSTQEQSLMIDYLIYFVKANGRSAPKVFKWTQKQVAPGQRLSIEKKQPFKPISTRKYYSGLHKLEIQVNGEKVGSTTFDLIVD
ncbi:MAG: DNA alkylation repair protein [Bacteroidota bacterium]